MGVEDARARVLARCSEHSTTPMEFASSLVEWIRRSQDLDPILDRDDRTRMVATSCRICLGTGERWGVEHRAVLEIACTYPLFGLSPIYVGGELPEDWQPTDLPEPIDRYVVLSIGTIRGYMIDTARVVRIADLPESVGVDLVRYASNPHISIMMREPCSCDPVDWDGVLILLDEIEARGIDWIEAARVWSPAAGSIGD